MKASPAHKYGWVVVALAVAGGMIVISLKSLQSDVDVAVARLVEEHRCPHCGHLFHLSIAEATAMRRQYGDILCPVCGKPGAERTQVDAVGLVNTMPPPHRQSEEVSDASDEDSPPPATHDTSAATGLSRKPPEGG